MISLLFGLAVMSTLLTLSFIIAYNTLSTVEQSINGEMLIKMVLAILSTTLLWVTLSLYFTGIL